MALNYSKWDKIGSSDDEDDTVKLPGDVPSLEFRLRHETKLQKAESDLQTDEKYFANYKEYSEKNRELLKQLGASPSSEDTEKFLLEHPFLVSSMSTPILIAEAAKFLSYNKADAHFYAVKCAIIDSMIANARRIKIEPTDKPYIQKYFNLLLKSGESHMESFNKEVNDYERRIIAFAMNEKLSKEEVLQSLPEDFREAFMKQDSEKLKTLAADMGQDFLYHVSRCVKVGLLKASDKDGGEKIQTMLE